MTREDYINLYEKYLSAGLTPAEKELLDQYRDDFLLQELPWDQEIMGERKATGDDIFHRLQAGLGGKSNPSAPVSAAFNIRLQFIAAAAVLLIILIGGTWLMMRKTDPQQDAGKGNIYALHQDIAPGKDKAILTLADGTSIPLDSGGKQKIRQQGNIEVAQLDNGRLVYDPNVTVLSYNTVSTPRGGRYQVVLPDGTKVWLNAASLLRFPTAFAGRERRVELSGEGYFEVAKNPSRPFRVSIVSADMFHKGGAGDVGLDHSSWKEEGEIEVLGTSFNVMAYNEEGDCRTTLVEGAVKVLKGGEARLLKPGQQSAFGLSGAAVGNGTGGKGIQVLDDADLDEATAWKDDRFEFNGNIRGIMRQIARWYDVEVSYEAGVSEKAFGGAISRKNNVSEVLKILELTGRIHFAVEGKKIIVKP